MQTDKKTQNRRLVINLAPDLAERVKKALAEEADQMMRETVWARRAIIHYLDWLDAQKPQRRAK